MSPARDSLSTWSNQNPSEVDDPHGDVGLKLLYMSVATYQLIYYTNRNEFIISLEMPMALG